MNEDGDYEADAMKGERRIPFIDNFYAIADHAVLNQLSLFSCAPSKESFAHISHTGVDTEAFPRVAITDFIGGTKLIFVYIILVVLGMFGVV